MDEWTKMRGSQIPAFGNWEDVNEMPITQYFECARQAGLIRYSSSSGEYEHNNNNTIPASPDLYSLHYINPPSLSRTKQGKRGRAKRSGGGTEAHVQVKGGSKKEAGKVYDVRVTEQLPKAVLKKKQQQQHYQYDAGFVAQPCRPPKAVDEDLYHIPPELLKRKRRMGFFSRCLVPPCAV